MELLPNAATVCMDASTASTSCGAKRSSTKWPSTKKHRLSQKVSVPRRDVFQIVEELAEEIAEYFINRPRVAQSASFVESCVQIVKIGKEVELIAQKIQSVSYRYDFDEKTPGNGYRSLICTLDTVVFHLIRLLRKTKEQRNSMVFRSSNVAKELEAFVSVFRFLSKSVIYVFEYQNYYPKEDLFPSEDQRERFKDLLHTIEDMDPSCFYGRAMGFQFSKSMCHTFQVIGMVLATYSVGWEKDYGFFGSVMNSGKFFLSPELRAKRIIQVVRHADVSFCKGFWNLSEANFMTSVPHYWFCPPMALNEVQEIPADLSLSLPGKEGRDVRIPAPHSHTGRRPLKLRVLTSRFREGMTLNHRKSGRFSKKTEGVPMSSQLLFHVHGGGFVATTSKSHETYLRHWAKTLDCTIVSVDYSLAPDDPYPRALEEVLYAYAWVLNYPHRLGWTGGRICLTGDSAGGNLLTAMTLRAIQMGVSRLPDGLVLAYTPFIFQYMPSPSRLLSVMDPLLPPGIILRCLAAYTGNLDLLDTEEDPHSPSSPTQKKSLQEYTEEVKAKTTKPNKPKFCSQLSTKTENDEIVSLVNISGDRSQLPSVSRSESASSNDSFVTPPTAESDDQAVPAFRQPPSTPQKAKKSTGEKVTERTAERMGHRRTQSEHDSPSPLLRHDSDPFTHTLTEEPVNKTPYHNLHGSEDSTVEIHRDPSRIWLASSVCDKELVDYLSEHRLTKDSLLLVNPSPSVVSLEGSEEEENNPCVTPDEDVDIDGDQDIADDPNEVLKTQLSATPSISTLELGEEDELKSEEAKSSKKMKLATTDLSSSPPKSGQSKKGELESETERNRSQSMSSSITRSISQTFTDTVALATGHAYDHLGNWFDRSGKKGKNLRTNECTPDLNSGEDELKKVRLGEEKKREENPLHRLRNMVLEKDMLISPMYAPVSYLRHMPPLHLVTAHMDPLLDDTVAFGKLVRGAGAEVTVDLMDSLPHGFLNFTLMSPECRQAAKVCLSRIQQVLSDSSSSTAH